MSVSFGINSVKGRQPNKPKKQTLAEFGEPTEDHPPSLDTLTAEDRNTEADRLQVIVCMPLYSSAL